LNRAGVKLGHAALDLRHPRLLDPFLRLGLEALDQKARERGALLWIEPQGFFKQFLRRSRHCLDSTIPVPRPNSIGKLRLVEKRTQSWSEDYTLKKGTPKR